MKKDRQYNSQMKKDRQYNGQMKKDRQYNSQMKKDRQYNGQMKNDETTHNDGQNTTHRKLRIEQYEPQSIHVVNSGVSQGMEFLLF
jgi:hypothetical protein